MGKNKRQFIDKKTAQKFTLVHRSQRDPLQADEESAQHVLVPVGEDLTADTGASGGQVDSKEEERYTYGIYFDDEYDYMKHLRTRGDGMFIQANDIHAEHNQEPDFEQKTNEKIQFGKILLPSEALPSKNEEKIGMLNKGVLPRGPQPDWDPDITAALDDAVDFDDPENVLDDDFMQLANATSDMRSKESNEEGGDDEEWETDSEEGSDIGSDHLLSDDELCDSEEETKSRFTSYSMSSSIIRRTEGLKILDDKFERIMEEYDEDEIGCIDHEDVTGNFNVNNDLVKQVVDEFIDDQKLHELSETKDSDDDVNMLPTNEFDSEEESDEKLFAQFEKEPKEKWDCESIISTYSNIYNHPKLIIEEQKHKKFQLNKHTGIPLGVFSEKQKDIKTDENDDDDDENEIILLNNVRNKDETPEEKKKRKQDIKEQRKNRRIEKKSNKMAFIDEYKNQEKVNLNRTSQKGIKM